MFFTPPLAVASAVASRRLTVLETTWQPRGRDGTILTL